MNVGIDIIENNRFNNIINDESRLKKIFTLNEISYFNNFSEKLTHISGHFCAKEAFVKALKTGFSKGISLLDVEVLHNKNGAPYINLNNKKLKKFLPENSKVELSISHCNTTSTAICIIYN